MKTNLEDQLLEKFSDVSKLMHQSTSVEFPNFSFSIREMITLAFIKKNQSTTVNQIAQHLKITMPTTTVLLDKLEKNDLIIRTTSPTDKRSVLIKLSSKALKLFHRLNKIRLQKAKYFLSFISGQDKHNLLKILDKLLLNLNPNHDQN